MKIIIFTEECHLYHNHHHQQQQQQTTQQLGLRPLPVPVSDTRITTVSPLCRMPLVCSAVLVLTKSPHLPFHPFENRLTNLIKSGI
jgi:hypothetical protein